MTHHRHLPAVDSKALIFLLALASTLSAQAPQQLELPRHGIDTSGMDRTVKPGDDFYRYANGKWDQRTVIPADRSSWGTGASVYQFTSTRLRDLFAAATQSKAAAGSVERRVGDFYASALDTATLDRRGLAPLKPYLDSLDMLTTTDQLLRFEVTHQPLVGGSLVQLFVIPDLLKPTRHVLYLGQGGLGLPDAPYYTSKKSADSTLKAAYRTYLAKLLTLSGTSAAEAARLADDQVRFDSLLAMKTRDRTQQRDIPKLINPRSVAVLTRELPNVNLAERLREAGVVRDTIVVFAPENLAHIDSLLGVTSVETLRTRYKLELLRGWAAMLGGDFRAAEFDWSGRALRGAQQPLPRWQTSANLLDANIGELESQLYTSKYFPASSKARAQKLVADLKDALRARVTGLDWMQPSTKAEALQKIDAVRVQIGYPDKWESYQALDIRPDDLFGNVLRARAWTWQRDIGRVGKEVDPNEWGGTPTTVDAWANPFLVTVTFPAAILQAPFFDAASDDALNYGSIGAVIGHELVHLFDDQGRLFDHTGALRDWWTPADAEAFTARTKVLVDQYNAFTVLDSLHINGQLTLGENTADLGGLMAAYDAFKRTAQGKSNQKIDGLTPDERFFLAFAQNWRRLTRDNSLRLLVQTDPHSPPYYRVNGPVSNFEPWYAMFGVRPGDKLYRAPETRAKIW